MSSRDMQIHDEVVPMGSSGRIEATPVDFNAGKAKAGPETIGQMHFRCTFMAGSSSRDLLMRVNLGFTKCILKLPQAWCIVTLVNPIITTTDGPDQFGT